MIINRLKEKIFFFDKKMFILLNDTAENELRGSIYFHYDNLYQSAHNLDTIEINEVEIQKTFFHDSL